MSLMNEKERENGWSWIKRRPPHKHTPLCGRGRDADDHDRGRRERLVNGGLADIEVVLQELQGEAEKQGKGQRPV